MNNKEKGNAVLWIIIILVILGGVWWYMKKRSNTSSVNPSTSTQTIDNAGGPDYSPAPLGTSTTATTTSLGTAPKTVTVNYTSAGFVPKTVNINKGDTVTWVNQTSHGMWVASASHPTHTVYDGTSLAQHCNTSASAPFDQCKSGSTYSFKFDKAGSWNYHDHTNSSMFGTVVVSE